MKSMFVKKKKKNYVLKGYKYQIISGIFLAIAFVLIVRSINYTKELKETTVKLQEATNAFNNKKVDYNIKAQAEVKAEIDKLNKEIEPLKKEMEKLTADKVNLEQKYKEQQEKEKAEKANIETLKNNDKH